VRVLALDGSPVGSGRTATAARAVLAGAEEAGAECALASLATSDGVDAALAALGEYEAFVFASPIYRASYATPMKALLDRLPRGMWGETEAPLQGRAAAIVATGATLHHFLGLQDLRSVLASFFAAHVLPPGLYVPGEGFDEAKQLLPDYADAAALTGRALVEQATALAASPALAALRPQA
jgi:FMN reductase